MTHTVSAAATGLPVACLPQTFSPHQEHRHLLRLVGAALDRIGELNRQLHPPADLPRSGLHLVGLANGDLLFRGGPRA